MINFLSTCTISLLFWHSSAQSEAEMNPNPRLIESELYRHNEPLSSSDGNDTSIEQREYTAYHNQECIGVDDDLLRDFIGSVDECKAKCDELIGCDGFVQTKEGKCHFRAGGIERKYEEIERDCYLPVLPAIPDEVVAAFEQMKTVEAESSHSVPDDAFSFVFMSDLECGYRGHYGVKCRNIVNFVKSIGSLDYTFDGDYESVKVDPELVIHGGDLSDVVYGYWKEGVEATESLFEDHWQQLYDAGIPMISTLGNHDYIHTDPHSDAQKALSAPNDFVRQSYFKTQQLAGNEFDYEEFTNTHIVNGPSLFISEFKGLQIINLALVIQAFEFDDQFDALMDAIDFSKETIFFGHFPLSVVIAEGGDKAVGRVKQLFGEFPTFTKYFCGHGHVQWTGFAAWENNGKTITFPLVRQYMAAYPHANWPKIEDTFYDAGFYAVLASPTKGVLQVKNIQIPDSAVGCWEDGTICGVGTTCNNCCRNNMYWFSKAFEACGVEPKWEDGTLCGLGTSCKRCKNEATFWPGKVMTACGTESCWGDGTVCLAGTTCKQCCNEARTDMGTKCGGNKWADGTRCGLGTTCNFCENEATYWPGKVFTACGSEPCWADGTVCLAGTTCDQCCNEARTDMGTKCGGNLWQDGTICAHGTTCNFCENAASHWDAKGFTACGTEPCFEDGTVCLAGTTCKQCCNEARTDMGTKCGGNKWADGTICAHGTTCDFCENPATFWHGKTFTACGTESCWGDGTVCVPGVSCGQCCNEARTDMGTKCGGNLWQDGTRCGLGTTCKYCQNSATHWHGKAMTACGREPCWNGGTVCGAGTTCNSCCNGQNCPWYWFGVCKCK